MLQKCSSGLIDTLQKKHPQASGLRVQVYVIKLLHSEE